MASSVERFGWYANWSGSSVLGRLDLIWCMTNLSKARTIPPCGGVVRAQVHRNRSLHLGNVHITLSCLDINGGENEEGDEQLLAEKGAVHNFISS